MFREQRTVIVDRPVHEVFEYMSDFSNDQHWRGELIEIVPVDGESERVGASYRQRVQWEGRELETDFRLTTFEPDRCIAFEGEAPGVRARASYRFEPVGATTRLHVTAEFETLGPMKVVEPFVWGLLRRQGESDLHALKKVLEEHLVHTA